jgi:hypothetical protein
LLVSIILPLVESSLLLELTKGDRFC